MKRSLSWLELLWYLPLYIISVYFHLNSVMVLVLVAVGYTVSHYHKYASSEEYRENYKSPFSLFIQRTLLPHYRLAVYGGSYSPLYAVSISS